jgi:hypothetical protein
MPDPHPKLIEWLENAGFRQHPEKPGLYQKDVLIKMPKNEFQVEIERTIKTYVDFRNDEKGVRYTNDKTIDKNTIDVLVAFKKARDALLAGKLIERPAQHQENTPVVKFEPKEIKSVSIMKSDSQIDAEIETAKAKRFLETRGSSYKVQGKERPDAHKIQNIANEHRINIEILKAEQTEDHAYVVVRAHLGNQFIDATVYHDFKTESLLKTMEIIKNNPGILDHYEGTYPVIKEGAVIKQRDEQIDAKYYLVHSLLSFKKFSLRDARTKAASIAEAMLLNREWRDKDEIRSEMDEKSLIETINKSH